MAHARLRPSLPAAVALGGLLVSAVAAATPAAPAPRGSIVISSTRDPALHDELWLLDVRTGRRLNVSRSPAADREPASAPGGRAVAFVSDRGGAEALYVSRPNGSRLRRLAGPFPEAPEWHVQIRQPRWSPDGARIAFVVESRSQRASRVEVRVAPAAGGASTRIVASPQVDWSVDWSPDSRRLAVRTLDSKGYRSTVFDLRGRRLWTIAGASAGWSSRGELVLLFAPRRPLIAVAGPDGKVRRRTRGDQASWSPDGRLLAVADEASIRVLDERGRVRIRSTRLTFGLGGSPWFPDGRALLVADVEGRLFRLALNGTKTAFPRTGYFFAWSPDGALASLDGQAIVVRRGGSTRSYPVGVTGGLCFAGITVPPAWVDRDHVLYAAGHGGQHEGDLWVLANGGLRRLPGGARSWRGTPVWSPDGSALAYEQGSAVTHGGGCSGPFTPHLRVADPSGANVRVLTRPGQDYDESPRWSPDGRRVAFERRSLGGDAGFGILVADAATGKEQRLTTGFDSSPTWTADGLTVVYQHADTEIRRVTVSDGTVTSLARGAEPEAAPTGALVAFLRAGALWTVRADGTDERRLVDVRQSSSPFLLGSRKPRWSPDGLRLAVPDDRGVLVVTREGEGGRLVPARAAGDVAWSRDGRTISFTAVVADHSRGIFNSDYVARTELYMVPASGGRPRRVTSDLANVVGAAAWRP